MTWDDTDINKLMVAIIMVSCLAIAWVIYMLALGGQDGVDLEYAIITTSCGIFIGGILSVFAVKVMGFSGYDKELEQQKQQEQQEQ